MVVLAGHTSLSLNRTDERAPNRTFQRKGVVAMTSGSERAKGSLPPPAEGGIKLAGGGGHGDHTARAGYRDGTPVFWAQEEPINMGAWPYLRVQFGDRLFERFPFAGLARPASSTPATGSTRRHKQEQREIVEDAFGNANEKRPPSPRGRGPG